MEHQTEIRAMRSERRRPLRWAAHNVRSHRIGLKRLHHPIVGDPEMLASWASTQRQSESTGESASAAPRLASHPDSAQSSVHQSGVHQSGVHQNKE